MSIAVQHLCKRFGDFTALDDVSLDVKPGELVALLGPSGSGKTTLLRIIAGLEFADSGQVLIDGADAGHQTVRDRKVGFVFQHYALFKHMTVFQNVAFGLSVRPREVRPSPQEIHERVMALLSLVHLEQFHNRYPHQLSGGQRQRVALARSLAVEPKLLLLDEPFGALDAKVRQELRRWLRRLHEDMHITSLFVTHDQEEALEVADRVVVMNRGRIEQEGSPEDVYHAPVNGFVYDFLGNYNEFAGWRDAEGTVHLAEDDIWEAPRAPTLAAAPHGWLSRYPEVSGLLGRYLPALRRPKQPEAAPARTARRVLPEQGTPVRVFARPHEMFVARVPEPNQEYIPVTVLHLNPAGPLAKLDLARRHGSVLRAEVPKAIIDQLGIRRHDALYVRPKNIRVFD